MGMMEGERLYELSLEQVERLEQASAERPEILGPSGAPMQSLVNRVNAAWIELGKEMGFDWRTARPAADGGNARFFFALPVQTEGGVRHWVLAHDSRSWTELHVAVLGSHALSWNSDPRVALAAVEVSAGFRAVGVVPLPGRNVPGEDAVSPVSDADLPACE